MIEIRHVVTITIGEKGFELAVLRANSEQLKQLSLLEKNHADCIANGDKIEKEISEISIQMAETQSILETNIELLKLSSKEVSFVDRCTLLWENKTTLIPKLAELKRKRAAITQPDYTKSYDLIETIYKKRFELLIENSEQKTLLAEYAREKSVTYAEIFTEISAEIAKEEKKKLNASGDGQK